MDKALTVFEKLEEVKLDFLKPRVFCGWKIVFI